MNFKGIIDTTLRDGQQSPLLFDAYKYRFSLDEKKLLINGLIKLGVTHLEFFSPVVGEVEQNDFIEIKKYITSITSKKMFLLAHCRCHETDIKQALNLGFDGLNLYMGASKYSQKYSYGKDINQIINLIVKTIKTLRNGYPKLYLRFSAEDAFRTSLEDIYKIYDQVYPYVNTLGIPDTVGMATPTSVRLRVKALKQRYSKANLECHFHNDRGYALINSITAVEAGAEYVDTSIWGLGERSGITSLTSFLFNLYYTKRVYCRKYHLYLCYPLNILMGSVLNMQVLYTESVSLTNRTHIAGVHQKAVLNNKKVYEAHNLQLFGVSKSQVLLGPLTGWNLIYYYLKEVAGYDISKDQAKLIAVEFKKKAREINKKIHPEKLLQDIIKDYPLVRIVVPKQFEKKRIENLK